jgi:hypothetical protein
MDNEKRYELRDAREFLQGAALRFDWSHEDNLAQETREIVEMVNGLLEEEA